MAYRSYVVACIIVLYSSILMTTAQQYKAENLTVSTVNVNPNRELYLSWNHASNLNTAQQANTKYRINYSMNNTLQEKLTDNSATSYLLEDLWRNTTYDISLTTIFNGNDAGNVSIVAKTQALSFAVANLSISNTDEEEGERLQLNWDHANDATATRGSLIKYIISYRDTRKEKSISTSGSMNVSYPNNNALLTGLKMNTIYWINITTYLGSSNEGLTESEEKTNRTGISNEAVAGIAIGITIFLILLIAAITVWHFKKHYPKKIN